MLVYMYGGANNPLSLGSPEINWNYTIGLNSFIPSSPWYTLNYTHDCFPAHEVFVGNQQIHGYMPSSNDIATIAYRDAALPAVR